MVANSMQKEAAKELANISQKLNNIFQVMKFIKKNRKDIKRAKSMRGKAES